MFKPGQKVVYVNRDRVPAHFNAPITNEVVEIEELCDCGLCFNTYKVVEYPTDKDGMPQFFHARALKDVREFFAKDSDNDLMRIKESMYPLK